VIFPEPPQGDASIAEFIVLFGHAEPEAVVNEIEALLLIHFPESEFRFGVASASAQGFLCCRHTRSGKT
jgi:hypothetical protein